VKPTVWIGPNVDLVSCQRARVDELVKSQQCKSLLSTWLTDHCSFVENRSHGCEQQPKRRISARSHHFTR